MADLDTFTALFADQTEDVILARWRDWANEDLDPATDVDEWVDTREGSHWFMMTTPGRREAARLYDLAGSEVPASVFPQFSWGPYLDLNADLRKLTRLSATVAEGVVRFTAPAGTVIPAGTTVGTDDGTSGPEFSTVAEGTVPGGGTYVDVAVESTEAGSAEDVGPGAVTRLVTSVDGVTAVTNPAEIVGGTDVEDDEALRARVSESYTGVAAANQLYYRRLLLNQPGIGRVTVLPAASGAGTITIVISTASGQAVSGAVLAAAQALVDPGGGAGVGEGQVGAAITVLTAAADNITVAGTLTLEPGYSLAGTGGTVAVRAAIEAALAAYVNSRGPGDAVTLSHVIGAIVSVRGVRDVSGVTINGSAANHTVPATPPKAAVLVTPVTLS